MIVLGSLWSGTLGFLHISQSPTVKTSTSSVVSQSVETSTIKNIRTPDSKDTDFYKDSNYIYVYYGTDGFEPYAGQVKPSGFDEKYKGKNLTFITGVDVPSFAALGSSLGTHYFKDKNRVYCQDLDLIPILNADSATFTLVFDDDSVGAKDKNHKYLGCSTVQ